MSISSTAPPPAARLLEQNLALRDVALVLLFGALTALSAQIRWYLPGNPVPITGQVFLVLLSGALLGARLGAWSQLAYLGFGVLGAPVFAGGLSGVATLAGPTGGYLVGFVLAAALVGAVVDPRRGTAALLAAMAGGVAIIYLCGAVGLAVWGRLTQSQPWPSALSHAVAAGVLPFVLVDAVKVALAAAITRRASRC